MSTHIDSGADGSGGSAQDDARYGNTHTRVDAAIPGAPELAPPDVLRAGGDARLRCPTRMPCQSESLVYMGQLLFASANIANDARFVAIADQVILAERGADTQPVVYRQRVSALLEFATTQLSHPKAVAITGDSEITFSLLCDDARCEVFELGSGDSDQPERVASIDAKTGALTGIVHGGCTTNHYDFCVFGDGLFCFDGKDWTTEIDTSTHGRILAAAVDRDTGTCPGLLVAGEHGMLQRYHAGWQAIDTGTAADLTTLSAFSGRFSAAGEGVLIEGDPYGFLACKLEGFAVQKLIRVEAANNCIMSAPQGGGPVIDEAAAARGFNSGLYAITPQGQLVIGHDGCSGGETWECDQQSVPNIDFSITHCGIATNPWQLTADELNGSKSCPID
jgi:hypothetical protein